MIFTETKLPGAFVITLEKREDERGFFARTFCQNEFRDHGLNPNLAQCNISYNKLAGTLRGMHFQAPPHPEAKLIHCVKGSIYDVILDLRQRSRTYGNHVSVVLTATEHNMIYVPEEFAHGFITLEDETEVYYLMSDFHAPHAARGVRWNDSAFALKWPRPPRVISERDATYPDFTPNILE